MSTTQIDIKNIVASRMRGTKWRTLAEQTGVPLTSLRAMVTAHPDYSDAKAGEPGAMRMYVTKEEVEKLPEIRAVLDDCMKPHEAASKYGVNLGTLENRLRKLRSPVAAAPQPAPATPNNELPAAGHIPLITYEDAAVGHIPPDAQRLHAPRPFGPNAYLVHPKGDSMIGPDPEHSYPPRLYACFDPDQTNPPSDTKVLALVQGHSEPAFRYYKSELGRKWLQALNPKHPDIPMPFTILATYQWGFLPVID